MSVVGLWLGRSIGAWLGRVATDAAPQQQHNLVTSGSGGAGGFRKRVKKLLIRNREKPELPVFEIELPDDVPDEEAVVLAMSWLEGFL